MVPLAFGLVMGAGSSVKLVAKLGTTRVVTAGLLLLAGVLSTSLLFSAHMPYWPLGLWFFGAAVSMGWIMGPTTDSVMGAVPEEKAGVASAMNDVSRQVGGSLGTAVVGSLMASLYASRMSDATAALPAGARSAARDSIGRANAVADTLPAAQGHDLAHAAASAFTDALGIGFSAAAACAVVGALIVARRLPARHLPAPAVDFSVDWPADDVAAARMRA
jgi:hypothetical protein